MRCNNCGKGIQYGHNVSHSKRRTRKIWKPNLHVFHMQKTMISSRKKVKLCTSCLRRAKEEMKVLLQKETIRQMADKIHAPQVSTTNL